MEDSRLVDGAYHGYRVSVRLVRESTQKYRPYQITGPKDLYEFFSDLGTWDRETLYCVHLDQRNRIVSCEEVSRGTLAGSLVHPREVYKAAILSSAASITIVHNHPSGDPEPSSEDHEVFNRLIEAGRILGIPLLDSVIVGDDQYYSMRDSTRCYRDAETLK